MSKKTLLGIIGLLLGLAMISALWGCGVRQLAQGELQPPKVIFKGLSLNPPKAEGWPLACNLLVKNPNLQPLRLRGYDYEVWLEGQRVVQGESLDNLTIPAQGQETVVVPVFFKFPALSKVWRAILRRQTLHYEIAGSFRLASLVGGLRVPFRFQGQLTEQDGLERLQQFLDRRIRKP